jgi:hypothetical protein
LCNGGPRNGGGRDAEAGGTQELTALHENPPEGHALAHALVGEPASISPGHARRTGRPRDGNARSLTIDVAKSGLARRASSAQSWRRAHKVVVKCERPAFRRPLPFPSSAGAIRAQPEVRERIMKLS